MAVQITIRGVPEEVRDELAAKAALERRSMQQFLLCELERIASRPAHSTVLERIRARKEGGGIRISVESILGARDRDRK